MDSIEKLEKDIVELKKEREQELKEIDKFHYGTEKAGLELLKYLDKELYNFFRSNLFYYRIAIKFKERKLKQLKGDLENE